MQTEDTMGEIRVEFNKSVESSSGALFTVQGTKSDYFPCNKSTRVQIPILAPN